MDSPDDLEATARAHAERIAAVAQERGLGVAAAESLTGGRISCHLAAAPDASSWYRGAVIAYASEVKYAVLGVPVGPVVSEQCARSMADGVARLLGAQVAVAVTGVGGPDEQEGQPPGTVWIAARHGDHVVTELAHLDGDPDQILDATVIRALELLERALSR